MECKHADHIQHKNLQGYVVCEVVPFLNLTHAEQYCAQLGVDPDVHNLQYNPAMAKWRAIYLIAELNRWVTRFQTEFEQISKSLRELALKRDEYKETHTLVGDMEAEYYQERIVQGIGRMDALSKVLTDLRDRENELRDIARLSTME